MELFFTFLILGLCFYFFTRTSTIWRLNQTRRKGLFSFKGKPTMFDVRRLLIEGEKDAATRVYGEIFHTNYKDAQKAIDELERSIREKAH
jgi:hypothetical protein